MIINKMIIKKSKINLKYINFIQMYRDETLFVHKIYEHLYIVIYVDDNKRFNS